MMIDYDKLKVAHRLAQKMANDSGLGVYVQIHFTDKMPVFNCHIDALPKERMIDRNLDSVIDKLRELIQPQPKYEVDSKPKAWFLNEAFEPQQFTIFGIKIENDGIFYERRININENEWREESTIYPSREALITSQIRYWSELMKPTLVSDSPSNFSSHKKCGCAGCNGLGECNFNKCEPCPSAHEFYDRLVCEQCGLVEGF